MRGAAYWPPGKSRILPMCRRSIALWAWSACVLLAMLSGATPAAGQGQAAPAPPPAESLELQTSDGVRLNAVHYPVAAPQTGPTVAAPVVILLHDLGGSNESVAGLAQSLQARGIAVVVPDLRGHGGSTSRIGTGSGATLDAKALKKPDFEAMLQARGGRLRDQAAIRGDVEVVRGWIKEMAGRGVFDMKRLFVVGSGVGAAVAAGWTIDDAAWPDIASGPQGREVRGLVMISPAWTTRGFSISPSLSADAVKRAVPILVIASGGENGGGEKDAERLFDQLKRARPAEWYEQRADAKAPTPNPKKGEDDPTTLFFLELATAARGDSLATLAGPGGDVAGLIAGFIATVAPAGK